MGKVVSIVLFLVRNSSCLGFEGHMLLHAAEISTALGALLNQNRCAPWCAQFYITGVNTYGFHAPKPSTQKLGPKKYFPSWCCGVTCIPSECNYYAAWRRLLPLFSQSRFVLQNFHAAGRHIGSSQWLRRTAEVHQTSAKPNVSPSSEHFNCDRLACFCVLFVHCRDFKKPLSFTHLNFFRMYKLTV